MEYKVGDEILIKAVITGSREDESKLLVRTTRNSLLVEKKDVIPAPDMTAEEAWDISKKISLIPSAGGLEYSDLQDIFGTSDEAKIIKNNTPQQAKAKIEAWESEKKIKVGDVVDHNGEIGIVTNTDDEEGFYNVLYSNGSTSAHDCRNLKKTGRHIDITRLLEQIGESDA